MNRTTLNPCLAITALAALASAQSSDLTGRWVGRLSPTGAHMSVVMNVTRDGDELTGEFQIPERGVHNRLSIAFEDPDVEMQAFEGQTLRARISAKIGKGLLTGTVTQRGLSPWPLEMLRIAKVSGRELELYVGQYRTESGERVSIDRHYRGTEDLLICATEDGVSRMLFPRSKTEWVAGPTFDSALPIMTQVVFSLRPDGRADHIRWSSGDTEQVATRLRLQFDEGRIEARLRSVLVDLDVPSISIGIVDGEELAFSRSIGVMHRETGEPSSPDTLYQIASVTKTFTAMLATILRDEGVLDFDRAVRQYLPPDVAMPPRAPLGAPAITIRHLLTHTAGLPLQPTNYLFEGRYNNNYTVELLYAGLPEAQPLAPVDSMWSYSNLGYVLLSHLLARVGDASFEELLEERIFDPLGMSDTTVTLEPAHLERLATHYWSDKPHEATGPWHPGEIAGQGGITSSVRDLARYVSMQFRTDLESAGPISGSSLREIQRPQRQRGSPTSQIGYGWFIVNSRSVGRYLYHDGFNGGHSSWVGFSPAHKVGVIVLVNFGFEPISRLGPWLMAEAVRTARYQRLPNELTARRAFAEGDWQNAAWAYELVTAGEPDDGHNFDRLAQARANLRQFEAASEAWQIAARLGYEAGPSLYNAALAKAVAGDVDEVISLLERAAAAGYRDVEIYENDPALDSLRSDPRFVALLERIRAR